MVAMIGKKIKDNDFMCSQQIEKLETAKEIDAINWAIYSQKKKEAELDGKELELVKE